VPVFGPAIFILLDIIEPPGCVEPAAAPAVPVFGPDMLPFEELPPVLVVAPAAAPAVPLAGLVSANAGTEKARRAALATSAAMMRFMN
jgi:hypothetical protein